ncbi:FAD binding domain-containing protein [Paenibacillus sp. P26]|nr:FAD binding domain-containing protein [Paenibacillus sp. P26]
MAIGVYEFSSGPQVWRPSTLHEAWELAKTLGEHAEFVAGSTLLRTQWESGLKAMAPHFISLEYVQELHGISLEETGRVRVGSLARLSECREQKVLPLLAEASRNVAAPSIRRLATLGGNIVSGTGDALPALLVQDAELVWFDGKERRTGSLADWLALKAEGAEERGIRILVETVVEREQGAVPDGLRLGFYHKVGRREMFVPSLVTAAGYGLWHRDGSCACVRLAVGGGSSIPRRLLETERLLASRTLNSGQLKQVQQSILEESIGCSDAFATKEYRRLTAANLIVSELWKPLKSMDV